MEKNINLFSHSKFGDRFKTRDGRMAIFVSQQDCAGIIIEGEEFVRAYYPSGKSVWKSANFDIVSRWQEPVDENVLEQSMLDYMRKVDVDDSQIFNMIADAFEEGYKTAKQE